MRDIYIGIGHEKGAVAIQAIALTEKCRAKAGVTAGEVKAIVTIDARADDGIVSAVAQHYDCHVQSFSAAQLEAETPRLANPSDAVFRALGCHGVAEAAALAAAGPAGRLILPKTKGQNVTCAIAEILVHTFESDAEEKS